MSCGTRQELGSLFYNLRVLYPGAECSELLKALRKHADQHTLPGGLLYSVCHSLADVYACVEHCRIGWWSALGIETAYSEGSYGSRLLLRMQEVPLWMRVLYFAADLGVCIGRQRHALKEHPKCRSLKPLVRMQACCPRRPYFVSGLHLVTSEVIWLSGPIS